MEHKKTPGNPVRGTAPTNVTVRIGKLSRQGARLAHIVVDGEEKSPQPLSSFSNAITEKFGSDPQPGQEVACQPTPNPRPSTMIPKSGSTVPGVAHRGAPSGRSRSGSRGSRIRSHEGSDKRVKDNHKIVGYPNSESLRFDTGYQVRRKDGSSAHVKVDSLKVTDRFLSARRESVFREVGSDMEIVEYARDVSQGLGKKPSIDQNPYNFAPWFGTKPNAAQEPEHKATHHIDQPDRISGSICVAFTAHTPIFVPVGVLKETESDAEEESSQPTGNSQKAKDFFHCWDGSSERYAIPGASIKGVVRCLFEALTNSRAGVTDADALKSLPLYRRRSFKLFEIISVPTVSNPIGGVVECKYGLYDSHGKLKYRTTNLPDPNSRNGVNERPFAANLFWVEPHSGAADRRHGHTHQWKIIRYRPSGKTFEMDLCTVMRFCSMKGHPHLKDHGGPDGTAASASRCFYESPRSATLRGRRKRAAPKSHAPNYSEIQERLFELRKGDLIFGIPDRGANTNRLYCFGRNVNFLWPAETSALRLLDNFAERGPDESQLQGSDPAEATFGFAGTHRRGSHPFSSRVRFGTFWGPEVSEERNRPCVHLMPLTAPSGTKAKARPLYLKSGKKGAAADYDGKTGLRGRKFYWHQRGTDHGVPKAHRFDVLKVDVPEDWESKISKQDPPLIRPLPACTTFGGKIHFSNLTEAELGALLVSLKPDLAFDQDAKGTPRFGIKIGKGKPRGLGSVTATVKLQVDVCAETRYSDLNSPVRASVSPDSYVCAYKSWIHPNGKWDDLGLAKALRQLLRLPSEPSTRVYPPHFAMYGWLPKENDPFGRPKGFPPTAMKLAEDL